jgi:hypothetical protein
VRRWIGREAAGSPGWDLPGGLWNCDCQNPTAQQGSPWALMERSYAYDGAPFGPKYAFVWVRR